jgi:hypothetical protein
MLRFCMPRVRRRGHGLGNELLPWARAFLASQVLEARLLSPAFGMNRRGYWRDFFTSPDDWIYHRALEQLLPAVEFSEADWLEHGGGDVVPALHSFAQKHGLFERRLFLLVTDGLWGGFRHVEAARGFIRATLHQSRYAAANLIRLHQRLEHRKIQVAMHVRLGDFAAPVAVDQYRTVANASLPIEWFCNVAASLRQAFGEDWQLLLITDGRAEQLQPLTQAFPCVTTADMSHNDCSDVLALAAADLLVCSASTYSSLAAFLSDSPYLWFAPSLYAHPEGCFSTHGFAAEEHDPNGPTRQAVAEYAARKGAWHGRGAVIDLDGRLPSSVLDATAYRRALRRASSDLVRSGVAEREA